MNIAFNYKGVPVVISKTTTGQNYVPAIQSDANLNYTVAIDGSEDAMWDHNREGVVAFATVEEAEREAKKMIDATMRRGTSASEIPF
jgi:hypothetical protein